MPKGAVPAHHCLSGVRHRADQQLAVIDQHHDLITGESITSIDPQHPASPPHIGHDVGEVPP
jgi:hypothetical protein